MAFEKFEDAEAYIQQKPSEAIRAIDKWEKFQREFVRENPGLAHEFYKISTSGSVEKINKNWAEFTKTHPDLAFKPTEAKSIHDGMVLQEAWRYVRSTPAGTSNIPAQPTAPISAGGAGGAAVGVLSNALKLIPGGKPKYMEDDPEYQATQDKLMSEWYDKRADFVDDWERKNGRPDKNDARFQRDKRKGSEEAYKEGLKAWREKAAQDRHDALEDEKSAYSRKAELDYIFGSIDEAPLGPDGKPMKMLSLADDTREAFAKTVEGRRFFGIQIGKRLLDRYDHNQRQLEENTYSDPDKDPHLRLLKQRTEEHQLARDMLFYEETLQRELGKIDPDKRAQFEKEFSFEKFLKDKRHLPEIARRRRLVAEFERKRWESGKYMQAKKDAYAGHLNDYIKGFDYIPEEGGIRPSLISMPEPTRNPNVPGPGQVIPPQEEDGTPEEEQPEEEQPEDQQDEQQGRQGGGRRRKGFGRKVIDSLVKQGMKATLRMVTELAKEGLKELWQGLLEAVSPWILPVVLVFAIIGLLFLIIYLILQGGSSPITQLQCSSDEVGRISGQNSLDMEKTVFSAFEVHLAIAGNDGSHHPGDPGTAIEREATKAAQLMFSTVCILFGHDQGTAYDPVSTEFNTFGTLAVGSIDQRPESGSSGPWALPVYYTFGVDVNATDSDCILKRKDDTKNLDEPIQWTLFGANGCNQSVFQFLIAKSLGQSIVKQQAHLAKIKAKYTDVFSEFQFSPDMGGAFQNDNRLPTHLCLTASSINDAYYNCFGDMIGEYLVYPYYLDASLTDISSLTPTPTPGGPLTPTPTSTLTPTPLPPGKPTPTPTRPPTYNLRDYPIGRYSDYYKFAYNNLFDKKDFFVAQSIISCPTETPTDLPGLINAFKDWKLNVIGGTLGDKVPMIQDDFVAACLLMQSSTYKSLLQTDTTPVTINFSDDQDCCGFAPNQNQINIYGKHNGETSFNKFTLAHELSHIIKGRNLNTATDVWKDFDTNVYTSQTALPTFNCQHDYDDSGGHGPYEHYPNGYSECFADAIGLYLTYPTFDDIHFGGASTSMSDYPSGLWSKYYNFVKTEIFGGLTFYSPPGAGGDFAGQVVDAFKATPGCFNEVWYRKMGEGGGWAYLNKQDESCIDNVQLSVPKERRTSLIQIFKDSIDNIYPHVLQCVAFVKGVAAALNKPFDTCGNATHYSEQKHWDSNAGCYVGVPDGYRYIAKNSPGATIYTGDIVIYHAGAGHIAYVTGVSGSGSNIFVKLAEGNGGYCGLANGTRPLGGCVDRSTDSLDNANLVGWLRPL